MSTAPKVSSRATATLANVPATLAERILAGLSEEDRAFFGFPKEGIPSTFTSKNFGGRCNFSPRGNYVFTGLSLGVGISGEAFPYVNPNREGRGGCSEYTSKVFGTIEVNNGFYILQSEEDRNTLLERVVNILGGEDGARAMLARIAKDTRECSANRKARRVGSLA